MKKVLLCLFLIATCLIPIRSFAVTAYCFGDSFTYANVYPPIIGTAQSWTITNYGVNGSTVYQWIYPMYSTSVATGNKGWVLGGFNSMRYFGSNTQALADYKAFLYAMGVWMALPDASKIRGQSGSITYTGSWSNASIAYAGGTTTTMAKSSYTQNDMAQISLSGSTIYIGYVKTSAVSGGTFTVHVDGALKGTYNCFGAAVSQDFLSDNTTYALRISGLTNTSHTILVTVTSATNASNKVYLEWFASNNNIDATIQFYMSSTCLMNSTGYTLGSPYWNHGSDAAVSDYSAQTQAVVCDLQCDGLKVYLADSKSYYLIPGDVSGDNIHPTTTGYQHIANAFNDAISNNSVGTCAVCPTYFGTINLGSDGIMPIGPGGMINIEN